MRYLKTTMLMVASLVLPLFLGMAGCNDDHRTRFRHDRDRSDRYERRDSDRHDDRGGISGHYREERRER